MSVRWLDSAYPPNAAQVAGAKAAGITGWSGYFAGLNILHGWSQADFDLVKAGGLATFAYCSGWSDPAAMKAQSIAWQVPICLDCETAIRGDGPWVQPWLDASGSGLYGNYGVFPGKTAAFYVLAAYLSSGNPGAASWWNATPQPAGPCGWQWVGTHSEFGISVDSSWMDDWFAAIGVDMTPEQDALLRQIFNMVLTGYHTTGPDGKPLPGSQSYAMLVLAPKVDASTATATRIEGKLDAAGKAL